MVFREVLLATSTTAALLVSAYSANAAMLYQSVPDLSGNPAVNAWCSSCGGMFRYYSAFSLASAATIDAVTAVFANGFDFPSDITVSIHEYTPGSNKVGATVGSTTVNRGSYTYTHAPFITEIATLTGLNFTLSAGNYLISFFNANGLAVPGFTKMGAESFQTVSGTNTALAYGHSGQTAGFALNGTLATPGPIAGAGLPMLLGMFGYGAWRRRRQAA